MLARYAEQPAAHRRGGRGRANGSPATFRLAVASSSNRSAHRRGARDRRASPATSRSIVSSEEVARGKPAPDVFLEAARRLGVAPERCAAVEDSGNGIRAAHAAGMRVIAIPNRTLSAGRRCPRARRRGARPRSTSSSPRSSSYGARPRRTQALCPPRPIAFESATSTCVRARLVRHVVEIALRIRVAVVDRRREHALVERADAHHRLDRTSGSEEMPEHGLRRRDGELVRMRAEHRLDRLRLGEIALRRRRPVRVDVARPARARRRNATSAARIISATPTESGSGCAMWCASFDVP